jgi:hypothetical protein
MSLERGTNLEVKPVDNAPSVVIGTVTTLPAGGSATVVNVGSAQNAVLNIAIPQGAQGIQGIQGVAGNNGTNGTNGTNGVSPNLTIGSVTTLSSGSSATASVSGTFPNLLLNLGIPMGATGSGSTVAWGGITGVLSSQTDLQTALNAKAASSHSHAQSDVTGLAAALADKASLSGANVFTYGGPSPTIDLTTPNNGSTGGLRVRTNPTSGNAYIQFTNSDASAEYATILVAAAGGALGGNWFTATPAPGDNDTSIATTAFVQTALAGLTSIGGNLIGYRNLPTSRSINANDTLADGDKGKKIIWTGGVGTITLNPNSTTPIDSDAIGTIVNDGSGNLTLHRGDGTVSAKLIGTGANADRVIPPGCVATWFKTGANSYYVGGANVA